VRRKKLRPGELQDVLWGGWVGCAVSRAIGAGDAVSLALTLGGAYFVSKTFGG
jgi:hypothetical protein